MSNFFLYVFIIIMIGVTATVTMFSPLWFFIIVLDYLCIEYIFLLGGFLLWLNTKKERKFEETTVLRNILGVDGRICVTLCALYNLYTFIYCEHSFPGSITITTSLNEEVVSVWLLKLFAVFSVIQAIHNMLINERLIGISFVYYPPFCRFIKTSVRYIKSGVWGKK